MKKTKTTFYLDDETLNALYKLRDLEGRFISYIIKDMVFNRLSYVEKTAMTNDYYAAKTNDERFKHIVKVQAEMGVGEWDKRYQALLKYMNNKE